MIQLVKEGRSRRPLMLVASNEPGRTTINIAGVVENGGKAIPWNVPTDLMSPRQARRPVGFQKAVLGGRKKKAQSELSRRRT